MNVTERLADFVAQTEYDSLPDVVRSSAKRVILDTVGCAIGAAETDLGLAVHNMVRDQGGEPIASVLGTGMRTSPLMAAYANGRLANILDFDETFMATGHHANAALAAALASCEANSLSGEHLITSFTIGFEIGARIAHYAHPRHKLDEDGLAIGWTGIAGPAAGLYASCAAAAMAYGLRSDQISQAFGLCANYLPSKTSPFLWPRFSDLPTIKYEDTGWAAHSGLMATLMAKEGITGIPNIFDIENGLSSVAGWKDPDPGALTDDLSDHWWLPKTSFKPWPCCRWIHYSLTAFEQILNSEGIPADEIDQIELLTFPTFQSDPAFRNQDLGSNLVSISFSYAHAAAMVALQVPKGLDWFSSETVQSDQARKLRHLVQTGVEPRSQNPAAWGLEDGVVKVPSTAVVKAGGREYSRTIDYARGDPWDMATVLETDQLMEKFLRLTTRIAQGKTAQELQDFGDGILRLEEFIDLDDLQIKSFVSKGIES